MPPAIAQFDIGAQHARLRSELDAAIARVLDSNRFILGEEVAAFESEAADFLGVRYAVSCASGTDALHLALRAAGVGAGDEVITSAFSFIASAEAIVLAGASPVFADIDRASFNLSPAAVQSLVGPQTKAIMATHLYGHPADMTALQEIADQHELILLEDCAQSFGATYKGRHTGVLSTAGCFSFYPTKNLGACGDGGMVTTDDDEIAERIKRLRNHGMNGKSSRSQSHSDSIGWNSRLDEIQAAILRIKLKHVARFVAQRQQHARNYIQALAECGNVSAPQASDACTHAYNQFTIRCKQRDQLATHLADCGIETRIYYDLAIPDNPSMHSYRRNTDLPESVACAQSCLSLPMYPEMDDDIPKRVAQEIVKNFRR